jgi:hypothetical protein
LIWMFLNSTPSLPLTIRSFRNADRRSSLRRCPFLGHLKHTPMGVDLPMVNVLCIVFDNQMVGESFRLVVAGVRTVTTHRKGVTAPKPSRLFAFRPNESRLAALSLLTPGRGREDSHAFKRAAASHVAVLAFCSHLINHTTVFQG